MPLMDHGGRPPSGDAWSFEAALQAFKTAFLERVQAFKAHQDWLTRERPHEQAHAADFAKRFPKCTHGRCCP
jgi:hypothetical protein